MTTHRRAWMLRAGVVVALATSALITVPASPALAAEMRVTTDSVNMRAGGDATVRVEISGAEPGTNFAISMTNLPGGVSCTGGCAQVTVGENDPHVHLLTVKANANAQAANETVTVRGEGSDPVVAQFSLRVTAPTPAQRPTVREVSGTVTDQTTGNPVAGATVAIADSQNNRYDTVTGENGRFRFAGTAQNPIAPGSIELGASKDSAIKTITITGAANQSVTNQRLALALQPSPSPSASPSDEASAEPTPSEGEVSGEPTPGAATQPAANDSSGGFGSWALILGGGLLVALGVGAIVLLLVRRKEADDDAEDGAAGRGGRAARPAAAAAAGGYGGMDDATRITPRAGAGPDPTMVSRPALGDQPTMLQARPVVDEFPDPYGAPLPTTQDKQSWGNDYDGGQPTQAGYGYGNAPASGAGYGNAPASGAGYGNAPASGAGYGNAPASGAGYGNAPASGAGYGTAPASGAGYGNAPSSGSGYGYGDSPGSGAGYGAGGGRGDGYGGRDYGSPADRPAPGGGYGDRYDEPTGRYEPGGNTGNAVAGGYAPAVDPYDSDSSSYGQGRGYGGQDQGYRQPSGQQYGGRGGGDHEQPTGGYEPSTGGYERGNRYDAPATGGGYGQQDHRSGAAGGYEQTGGYDRDGYDQRGQDPRGGYDQRGGYDRGGYDQQPGGYDQRGGGYDRTPEQRGGYDRGGYDQPGDYPSDRGGQGDQSRRGGPQQPGRPDRGSLDWLDG